jgi:hypothetical protein
MTWSLFIGRSYATRHCNCMPYSKTGLDKRCYWPTWLFTAYIRVRFWWWVMSRALFQEWLIDNCTAIQYTCVQLNPPAEENPHGTSSKSRVAALARALALSSGPLPSFAEGPDEERNGLALCILHHKLYDLGAFTLEPSGRVLVSEQAHGNSGFDDSLMRHHGGSVRRPQRPEWHPDLAYLAWHRWEVFKGEARPRR